MPVLLLEGPLADAVVGVRGLGVAVCTPRERYQKGVPDSAGKYEPETPFSLANAWNSFEMFRYWRSVARY